MPTIHVDDGDGDDCDCGGDSDDGDVGDCDGVTHSRAGLSYLSPTPLQS